MIKIVLSDERGKIISMKKMKIDCPAQNPINTSFSKVWRRSNDTSIYKMRINEISVTIIPSTEIDGILVQEKTKATHFAFQNL